MKEKKTIIILITIILIIVSLVMASCQFGDFLPISSENKSEVEEDKESEAEEILESEEETEAVDAIVESEDENKESNNKNTKIGEEEISDEEAGGDAEDPIADEEMLKGALLDFFNAVIQDNEYMFFSSGTINMVGSEEEYKNGDKSDIYFIIKESHSNWENIEFGSIVIINNKATIEIIGDRMAEGTKYEGDKVIFDFMKENGQWKIDFSF